MKTLWLAFLFLSSLSLASDYGCLEKNPDPKYWFPTGCHGKGHCHMTCESGSGGGACAIENRRECPSLNRPNEVLCFCPINRFPPESPPSY